MEVTIAHSELIRALELVGKVSNKSLTLPVLQCVRIEAKAGLITIEATNLEITISIPVTGTITEEGVVAVPSQTLLQSVQFITERDVTLRTEDQVLQIETSNSNTSIKTFPADEFPTIHKIHGEELSLSVEHVS